MATFKATDLAATSSIIKSLNGNHHFSPAQQSPLTFSVVASCKTTKARASLIHLPHSTVKAPVFMPVGTKGTLKGILPEQAKALGVQLCLANTYHLALSPGPDVLARAGGLHKWANWDRSLLTDSGGFQMVSLLELANITEEGVQFRSPYAATEPPTSADQQQINSGDASFITVPKSPPHRSGGKKRRFSSITTAAAPLSVENDAESDTVAAPTADMILLTPEESIRLQNNIGADIIMQLDDVVSSLTIGTRVAEAMHRTIRWLDRCNEAHARPHDQCLFPIVQGGLDAELRRECARKMLDSPRNEKALGYAIGGLSGGEAKDLFWRMVSVSTDVLPASKPRYVMGVGYAVDLVVCVALGADMFDCVFPTRTARFGGALVRRHPGQLSLRKQKFAADLRVIDPDCCCPTCSNAEGSSKSRAFLHALMDAKASNFCRYITLHNLYFQQKLMDDMHAAIIEQRFAEFVQQFMFEYYTSRTSAGVEGELDGSTSMTTYPTWVVEALQSVNINLLPL